MTAAVLTEFASAERSPAKEIERQRDFFARQRVFDEILQCIPNPVMILNRNRQIIYANQAVQDLAQVPDVESVMGMRPGEALGCKHARMGPAKCGTTKFCRYCGTTRAILESQQGRESMEECRLTVQRNGAEEALDLRVWARPTEHNRERFTLLTLTDTADEKRRAFLERIFLHDIMNTAMALHGFSQLLEAGESNQASREHFVRRISFLSRRIMDEIVGQRQLRAAETGVLMLNLSQVWTGAFLGLLFDGYNRTDYLKGRTLEMAAETDDTAIRTDAALLGRVLGNMIKNAIEAAAPGETVRMGCRKLDGWVSFWVHNPEYISEEIQLQLFKRSFSTKEPGRGLGTYSMKYLTEKYLGGRISFTSTEKDGTTVSASYPIAGPPAQSVQ